MPRIEVETGISIYYEWHGDPGAQPLVLVRGTGGIGARWMPQVETYSERYRCLFFDNRGAGQSDTTDPPYSMELLARDTLGLMDALGIDSAHISGLSLGGAIAQVMAIEQPDRVRTLQMHGSWGKTHGYALRFFELLLRYLDVGGLDFYFDAAPLTFLSPKFFTVEPETSNAIIAGMKATPPTQGGLEGQIRASIGHDALERLGGIDAPTLITVGELDMCLPPLFSEELHAAIPASELVVFEHGSHLHSVEDAVTFNRVTLDWLDRVS
jgi:pimeloyl-ACP methyl ester carboxylesterase